MYHPDDLANLEVATDSMHRTLEAIIDERGNVRLLERVQLPSLQRALVTILDDAPVLDIEKAALLSEPSLARDWDRPEEDAAWSHLQPEQ
jgi:hypothetical protein